MTKSTMVTVTVALVALLAASAEVAARADKPMDLTQPTTVPGSRPASVRLTLDESVALGLHNSRTMRIAADAVWKSRGALNESRAAYLPTVASTMTYTHLNSGQSVSLPVGPNGSNVSIPVVIQDQKQIDLTAGVPVDITGQIGAAVSAAQYQELAQRLNYNATRNSTVADVKNAYLDVLRAKEVVGVAEQTLKNAQDQESTAAAYLSAGTGTKFDVLRAQTSVADAQQQLIIARNQVNLTTATLANKLGLDQNTPIETVPIAASSPADTSFNDNLKEAYGRRPEVFAADAVIHAAEKGLLLANRSQLPTLGLAWNLAYTPDSGAFSPEKTTWAAVATLSIPIFDGGVGAARRQQAHADVDSARVARVETLDTVALDVRQTVLSVIQAQERVKVATAALTQATEQYRLAEVRFKAGVTSVPGGSPLLEISDARTALATAETNRINSEYDLASAQAQLDRAVGLYAYNGTSMPGLPAPATGGRK